ncbi:MAG: hypothetical protein JJU02_07240 [Cryomorphaceae bacterium]|nr:hypothetical protein [Cryomorphaceae bacterium]
MTLKRFGLFRTKPPKGFDYQPLYYSEEKERKQEILRRLENNPEDIETKKEKHRVQVQRNWSRLKTNRPSGASSPVMLIMIIAILFLLTWYILFS